LTRLGLIMEPRVGEDTGPNEGCLRAGDCRNVLIGDLDLGGGIRMLDLFLSVRTAVGSGIVPIIERFVSFKYQNSYLQPPRCRAGIKEHTLAHFHVLLT
jgi:hypothetical protein